MPTLDTLPPEILQHCMQFDKRSLAALSRVNRYLAANVFMLIYRSPDLSGRTAAQVHALFRNLVTPAVNTGPIRHLALGVVREGEAFTLPNIVCALANITALLGSQVDPKVRATWLEALFEVGEVSALMAYIACSADQLETLICASPSTRRLNHHPLHLVFLCFDRLPVLPFRKLKFLDGSFSMARATTIPYLPMLERLVVREANDVVDFAIEWHDPGNVPMLKEVEIVDCEKAFEIGCNLLQAGGFLRLTNVTIRDNYWLTEDKHGDLVLLLQKLPKLEHLNLDFGYMGVHDEDVDNMLQIPLNSFQDLGSLKHLGVHRDLLFHRNDRKAFAKIYLALPPHLETLIVRGFPVESVEEMVEQQQYISTGAPRKSKLQRVRMVIDVDVATHTVLGSDWDESLEPAHEMDEESRTAAFETGVDIRHIGGPGVKEYSLASREVGE